MAYKTQSKRDSDHVVCPFIRYNESIQYPVDPVEIIFESYDSWNLNMFDSCVKKIYNLHHSFSFMVSYIIVCYKILYDIHGEWI